MLPNPRPERCSDGLRAAAERQYRWALMATPSLAPGFEIVHFVLGYHDGILEGIADWNGQPHHFEVYQSGPPDGPLDRYRLTPLSPEAFDAAVDTWGIWCRWEQAHRAGRVPYHPGPNPALPEDEDRRRRADEIVSGWLASSKAAAFLADAEFKALLPDAWVGTVRGACQVRWSSVGGGVSPNG